MGDENSIPTFASTELLLLKGLIANSSNPLTYLKGLRKDPKKGKLWLFISLKNNLVSKTL